LGITNTGAPLTSTETQPLAVTPGMGVTTVPAPSAEATAALPSTSEAASAVVKTSASIFMWVSPRRLL